MGPSFKQSSSDALVRLRKRLVMLRLPYERFTLACDFHSYHSLQIQL